MVSITPIKLNIAEKLKNETYRKKFFRHRAQNEIAMSIRSLREKRKMRQIDLAKKSKMLQSAISRIEQSEYSSWTLTTLFRVAESLDAKLKVIFEPMEDVIKAYEKEEKDTQLETQFYTLHPVTTVGNLLYPGDTLSETTKKTIQRDRNRNISMGYQQ